MVEKTGLIESIHAAGYAPPADIIWDGNLHRFATDAEKRHSRDGWYVAYDDNLGKAAAFGSWRDGGDHKWSNGTGRTLSAGQLEEIKNKKMAAIEAEKKARGQAAARAKRIYGQASEDIAGNEYLKKKGINPPAGVRAVSGISSKAFGFETEWKISGIIVPIKTAKGDICSLQIITDKKIFMPDGQTAQAYHTLGDIDDAAKILIAEGLSTAQSLHQATSLPVVIAFSAGNLPNVARIIRRKNATAKIIMCADDDDAGRKFAGECGFDVVLPGHGVNDFNDLHAAHGLDVIRAMFQDVVDDESWKADLIIKCKDDGTQTILCRVHNLILIMANAPEFRGRIKYNDFSELITVDGVNMDDVGPIVIKAQLEKTWIKEKVSTGDVIDSMSVVAGQNHFNPIKDYLLGLKWDGVKRIPEFYQKYFGCPNTPYYRTSANSLFVSAVARIFRPGCKVDLMTILVSPQGYGKTMLWKELFGDWCAELTANLNDKDFYAGLRGLWCIDFSELDAFSRAEVSHIKRIITSQTDHYRPHYGRAYKYFKRQCIFVGSTNNPEWLTDPTGGRRFLPISINRLIDVPGVALVKDQLWAEAVSLFKSGANWWDIPGAFEHQEDSYIGDSWEEIIASWLLGQMEVTIAQVLDKALFIEPGKQNRSDQTRVGNILRRQGWVGKRKVVNGAKIAFYYPG